MTLTVAAPGKAMLIGEYVVLDGAPAVVAAVGCHARATLAPAGTPPASPFIEAAVRHAAQALAEAELAIPGGAASVPMVDSSSFQQEGRKLGLGSSAAVTVAAVGVLFAAAGLDPSDPGSAQAIRRVAQAAHDEAQGVRGSGADVLAATFGGVHVLNDDPFAPQRPGAAIAPQRAGELRSDSDAALAALKDLLPFGALDREPPLALPLPLALVATREAASTPDLVTRYRECMRAGTARAERAHGILSAATRAFINAARAGDQAALLTAVRSAYQGYLVLGEAMGVALVTPAHAALAAAAEAIGAAAKPSGAGGGDLAVVFLPDESARAALRARLPPGCSVLDYPIGGAARGVHRSDNLENAQS